MMTILGEELISSQGSFRRVRRWLEGWIPNIGGKFTFGLTGKETVVECDVFLIDDFNVEDKQTYESA